MIRKNVLQLFILRWLSTLITIGLAGFKYIYEIKQAKIINQ